jgi:hypothetical protein
MVVTVVVVLIAERTGHGRSDVSGVQEFALKYAGVFALIGLTTAVGVGLVATDRILMTPGHRVVAQAVHRGVSLAALTALVAHIVLEILAHRAHVIDAVVPFLSQHRPLYIGCGTVASDLVVLIIVTGFLRGRFAAKWPWAWRAIHAIAYLMWPLSLVHGLFGGRAAQPYVDWSYGACLALVALALGIRFVASTRTRDEKLAHPVADRLSVPTEGLVPGTRVTMSPLGSAPFGAAPLSAAPPARQALLPGGTASRYAAPAGQYAPPAGAPAASAELSDSGSWTVPPDLTRPGGSRPGGWASSPDPAEGRAWAASHDLTDPGSWMAPADLAQPGRWSPAPPDLADPRAGQDWRYGPPSQLGEDYPTNPGLGSRPGYAPPEPGYPQPVRHARPGYAQPAAPEPAYPAPGYPEPGYPEPGYAESGNQAPGDLPRRRPQQNWPPSQDWPPPGYTAPADGTRR